MQNSEFTFECGTCMAVANLWLRDNCMCPECKVVLTQERQFQISSIDLDIKPNVIEIVNDVVNITWPDGHLTKYNGNDLRAFINPNKDFTNLGSLMSPPTKYDWKPWTKDFQPLRISLDKLLHDTDECILALQEFMIHGVIIINNASSIPNSLERLSPVFGPIHEVLFERIHNVKLDPSNIPNINDDKAENSVDCYNIAHTGLAVPPHNDFASYTWNPSVQCLHMLINNADAGMSCVVDSWETLTTMRKEEPELFNILCKFNVPYREFDENNETYTEQPIIRLDPTNGNITGLRFSNQLMQSINPLHPDASLFYRAYHYLSCHIMGINEKDNSKMSDRRSFRLSSGEIIVVAAHRVLHARSHIEPTGLRHLQDAYFCHDNIRNKLSLLQRNCNGNKKRKSS